jgi:hypothetical protein
MNHLIAALVLALVTMLPISAIAKDSHRVKGHTNKNGTYVAPHRKTNPDHSRANNYSSKGNTNPYTGKKGTKDPNKR